MPAHIPDSSIPAHARPGTATTIAISSFFQCFLMVVPPRWGRAHRGRPRPLGGRWRSVTACLDPRPMTPRQTSGRIRAAALALATGAVLACATNPVTGEKQLTLVSEQQEIGLGKQTAAEVQQSIGLYDDPKAQAYVAGIGKKMAAGSERPDLPWTYQVVDDAAVHAFALPGGPVYVTRGLMTHLGSEAELAAVLGHETGHITAKHSVDQISKQQLAQLGLGLGAVLKPEWAKYGQLAGAGMQLVFLRFGRDHERQADELGFKYLTAQGYDPEGKVSTFQTLDWVSQSGEGGRLPAGLSTDRKS